MKIQNKMNLRTVMTSAALIFLLGSSFSQAQTEVPGDPPAPPLKNLLAKPEVQKKLSAFQKGCETRFSVKACNCLTRNFKLKVNGRDVQENELDMAIAISARKDEKKFKAHETFHDLKDMIQEIESECVKNPGWEMDL